MGWIENWPIKFLNRNFVRRRLPAKSNSVPFWLNSLKYSFKNSDIPSRWIFFYYEFPLRGLVSEKNTPTVTSQIPLFLGGVFEQKVRVFEAREPSQDGTEDGFFLLAISRRSSLE